MISIISLIIVIALVRMQPYSLGDGKLSKVTGDRFYTYITDIAWVPGAKDSAICVAHDGEIWDYNDGDMSSIPTDIGEVMLESIDWKPEGSYALVVGENGIVLKFDGSSITELNETEGFHNNFNTVKWDSTGTYALLVGGSANHGRVYRFDGTSFEDITVTWGNGGFSTRGINDLAWSPSGDHCLMVGDYGGIYKYQNGTYSVLSLKDDYDNPGESYFGSSWRPDGKYALLVGFGGTIVKFDGSTFMNITSNTEETLLDVDWSSDSSHALIVGSSGSIFMYDGDNVTSIYKDEDESNINTVVWKPNGNYALIGGSNILMKFSHGKSDIDTSDDDKSPTDKSFIEEHGWLLAILIIIAVFIIVVVIFGVYKRSKRTKAIFPLSSQTPQSQDTQEPYEKKLTQQNLCLTCGQPLSYIEQYNSYYCYQCQKYA